MRRLLTPKIHIDSVYDLDINILTENNIKGIIIDIDNTLIAWDCKDLNDKACAFIEGLQKEGFKICILSNSTKKRVKRLNDKLNLHAVCNAAKPFKYSYKKAMRLMQTDVTNTAVIGDQLFTDILGGNKLGLFTILVEPISAKEFLWTRLMRMLEKQIKINMLL